MLTGIPEIRATASPTTEQFFLRADGPPTKAVQPEKIPSEIRLITAPQFQLQAAAAGKPKSFHMVAYTGVPMRLPNFPYPVIVDGAGLSTLSARMPILKDHDQQKIVGHSDKVTIDRQTGFVEVDGLVSGDDPDAARVAALGANEFPWQASIGAPVQEMEFVDEGETVTVNSRLWAGPLYVARKATLREISFVALGADGATSVTIAAAHTPPGKATTMFEQWLKARGFDITKLSDTEKATLQAAYDGEIKASLTVPIAPVVTPTPVPDPIADLRKSYVAETARINAIRRHCVNLPEIEAKAIGEGWTEQQTELEVLRTMRPRAPTSPPAPAKRTSTPPSASKRASACRWV